MLYAILIGLYIVSGANVHMIAGIIVLVCVFYTILVSGVLIFRVQNCILKHVL